MKLRGGRAVRTLLGSAAVVAAAACSGVFRQPEVRLESVRLGGIGLQGASLVARLHITNPNGYDLETRSLTYDLDLQDPDSAQHWVQLTAGRVEQTIQVPGDSQTVVEIPFEFRYRELGPAMRSLLEHGTFRYRVSGNVDVARPIRRTVPYRKSGEVALDGVR